MVYLQRRKACDCSPSLHLSSTLLLLSAILPSSSFAQLTTAPTTFQTSPLPSLTTAPPPSKRQNVLPSTTTATDNPGDTRPMFNYYFIIVAAVVLAAVLTLLYVGKRRKQKALLMRSNSQAALARDVEGLRHSRVGGTRAALRRVHIGAGAHTGPERTEGLDERGEAPPPYNAGSKPPSIHAGDGVREVEPSRTREGPQGVEMNRMASPRHDPPGYQDEATNNDGGFREVDLGMARPTAAVIASARRQDV